MVSFIYVVLLFYHNLLKGCDNQKLKITTIFVSEFEIKVESKREIIIVSIVVVIFDLLRRDIDYG